MHIIGIVVFFWVCAYLYKQERDRELEEELREQKWRLTDGAKLQARLDRQSWYS